MARPKKIKQEVEENVTTKSTLKKQLFTCVYCSTGDLKKENVYTSRNKMLDTQFTLCKACACREANRGIDEFHKVLMMLDIPFLPELYKVCEGEDNLFSAYMLRINNPKKKHEDGRSLMDLHYDDSPTLNKVTDIDTYLYNSDVELSELQDLFGTRWTREQLTAMNKELDKMFIHYGGERSNYDFLDLYTEIIKLKWLSSEKYDKGDTKAGKELSDLRQKMLKENKMNVQAMREKKDNDSIGTRIDWVENEPILPSKKYFDIDGISYMWDKLIDQLLRFVGANKKPVEEDALEMINYVEEHPEYCQDME